MNATMFDIFSAADATLGAHVYWPGDYIYAKEVRFSKYILLFTLHWIGENVFYARGDSVPLDLSQVHKNWFTGAVALIWAPLI